MTAETGTVTTYDSVASRIKFAATCNDSIEKKLRSFVFMKKYRYLLSMRVCMYTVVLVQVIDTRYGATCCLAIFGGNLNK